MPPPGGPQSCFWHSDEASANLQAVVLPTGGRSGEDYFGGFRKPFANYICQVFLGCKFP